MKNREKALNKLWKEVVDEEYDKKHKRVNSSVAPIHDSQGDLTARSKRIE